MNIRLFLSRVKYVMFLLRKKGLRYTYNSLHMFFFYIVKNPLLLRLQHLFVPSPSYLEIEVSTRCNLKCVLCEHTYWHEPGRDMSFAEFKGIVDQFPRLKWIGLTGIGESFINKDFLDMLRYVKRRDVFVELYDTFYFIDEKTSSALVDAGVDRILASIDGATKQTYEGIRVNSDFERVINNVRALMRIKKEKKADFPEVKFHFIITRKNYAEVPAFIELVASLAEGEDTSVQFSRMLHEFNEVKGMFIDIPREIIDKAEETARRLKIRVNWNADVGLRKPGISSCTEWLMPFIFVTGHVIPCCAGNEANRRDFQKATSLGNVFEHKFHDIWRGEKYSRLRQMLKRGQVPPQCANCCIYDLGKSRKQEKTA